MRPASVPIRPDIVMACKVVAYTVMAHVSYGLYDVAASVPVRPKRLYRLHRLHRLYRLHRPHRPYSL